MRLRKSFEEEVEDANASGCWMWFGVWRFTLVSIQVIARPLATADFRIVSGWAGSGEDESCPRYGKSAVQHADQ